MARVPDRPVVWRLRGPGPEPGAVVAALGATGDRFWLDDAVGRSGVIGWGATAASLDLSDLPGTPGGSPSEPVRFAGGWVGWIGYEAGRTYERQPTPVGPRRLPDSRFRHYPGGLNYDPEGWVIAGTSAFVDEARRLLATVAPLELGRARARLTDAGAPVGFVQGVQRALRHIEAGDCYQVNLARRLVLELDGDPLDAYLQLRTFSPASYGAFLETASGHVLSNSPELYLRVSGGLVESRPIKGTCGLGETPGACSRLGRALLASDKERAELTMIVDLVRNDLGRVCRPGSIDVGERRVRVLPTLQHAEQRVSGQLADGLGAADAIAASFPPGSVTGAPKVAAMAILGELEPHPRGVYTGAIGYLTDAGDACFSVAIRTATVQDGRVELHVGSGIVADSDPEAELAESDLKAAAFLGAWGETSGRGRDVGAPEDGADHRPGLGAGLLHPG